MLQTPAPMSPKKEKKKGEKKIPRSSHSGNHRRGRGVNHASQSVVRGDNDEAASSVTVLAVLSPIQAGETRQRFVVPLTTGVHQPADVTKRARPIGSWPPFGGLHSVARMAHEPSCVATGRVGAALFYARVPAVVPLLGLAQLCKSGQETVAVDLVGIRIGIRGA